MGCTFDSTGQLPWLPERSDSEHSEKCTVKLYMIRTYHYVLKNLQTEVVCEPFSHECGGWLCTDITDEGTVLRITEDLKCWDHAPTQQKHHQLLPPTHHRCLSLASTGAMHETSPWWMVGRVHDTHSPFVPPPPPHPSHPKPHPSPITTTLGNKSG